MYVETVNDLKLRRQAPDVRWVWVAVLASARQSPSPGYLLISERMSMTHDDLADVAAVSTETVDKSIDVFMELDMLERGEDGVLHVVNWDSRQFESDNRGGSGTVPSTEPPQNHNGTTAPETETETEENNTVVEPDGFDEFWSQYPARDGKKNEKRKAVETWKRMSKAKRDLAMAGVGHYAASGQRAKDAFRWLRDETWVDWQTPAVRDQAKPIETPVY